MLIVNKDGDCADVTKDGKIVIYSMETPRSYDDDNFVDIPYTYFGRSFIYKEPIYCDWRGDGICGLMDELGGYNGKSDRAWIKRHMSDIKYEYEDDALELFDQSVQDVGDWFYGSDESTFSGKVKDNFAQMILLDDDSPWDDIIENIYFSQGHPDFKNLVLIDEETDNREWAEVVKESFEAYKQGRYKEWAENWLIENDYKNM